MIILQIFASIQDLLEKGDANFSQFRIWKLKNKLGEEKKNQTELNIITLR